MRRSVFHTARLAGLSRGRVDSRPRTKTLGSEKEEKKEDKDSPSHTGHTHVLVASPNVVSASFYSVAKAVDGYSTKWLMDSGASHHITSFRDDFATYKAYLTPLLFRTAQDGDADIVQGMQT